MVQLSIRKLKKSYGEKEVLSEVSFDLEYGERVGLVGVNGCGKSTLLHLLDGSEEPDGGSIERLLPASAGTLEQAPDLNPEELRRVWELERPGEFRQTLGELGADGRQLERPTEVLSGGEQMKLALSGLLAREPELLLLDEPTNNLDFEGITALIETANNYRGTLLIVSHDRYFLDCTVTRILELENGRITEYFGNYTDYREEKARLYQERLHRWEEDRRQQQQVEQTIRQLKDWSGKAHRDSTKKDGSGLTMGLKEYKRAKAKHMDRQVKSQLKRLEKLKTEGEERPQEEKGVYFQVKSDGRRGRRILEAEGLSKAYGGNLLFQDSSFVLQRGEHVALFGPNGCGKTTLVRMIQGDEEDYGGRLWVSPAGAPFVLSQNIGLPPGKTPLEYYHGLFGGLDGGQRILLANMGLSARHLSQKIATLSLGERMKVKLGELVLSQCDFIILDEPTNYLDLHAREMLEETLSAYMGTLLVVSHDVYFLERVCDRVLLFEEGRVKKLELSFREYLERRGLR